ncbi:hypothetical protein [Pseudomonas guariconensis]|uniref:hypothetical protein n=1 Tax=Pseudomonas guariconensis TaxID=1288410 RepID=UPI0018ABDF05|nr:hypothetical protein [Pseudomonas guariconensis]MBF8755450.1 hypothetical protein [Pseudomonas guariconensis]
MNDIQSPQFALWSSRHVHLQGFTESEYDVAILEAQLLRQKGLVTEQEWIQMVKTANLLLTRATS